jgi:hypothetical protein
MLRPFEMTADKQLHTLSRSIGKKQDGEDSHAQEHSKGCDWKTGSATKPSDNLSQYANNKKICPSQQHGDRGV